LKISNLAENVIANKIKSSIFKQTLKPLSSFQCVKLKWLKEEGIMQYSDMLLVGLFYIILSFFTALHVNKYKVYKTV